jgi:TonB family protein
MALPLHFLPLEFSLRGGLGTMKLINRLSGLGLALMLLTGSSAILSPKLCAQETTPESAAKRKVKSKVAPEYPLLAKQLNVTGHVKIEVTISAEGKVTNTKVIGGNPVLVNSSIEAIKKWRFEPGPKETTEIIEFEFNGQN